MTTSIDTSHLVHDPDGKVVPWITRWTEEVQPRSVAIQADQRGQLRCTYADAVPDNHEGRILWQREGITRGGRPQWAHVNTYRQRAAVRKGLCEVCGRRIDERPISWLIPGNLIWTEFAGIDFGDPITMQAPTCSDCLRIAFDLCPHLRNPENELVQLKVLEWRRLGVFGNAFARNGEGEIERHNGVLWLYEDEADTTAAILGQQECIQFTKYAYVEVSR